MLTHIKRFHFIIYAVFFLFVTGCKEAEPISYSIPEMYSFSDAQGNSTVNFSGQTTRLNQLEELTVYMKLANTPGTALNEAQLLEMYSNNNGAGSSFFTEESNDLDKQLQNKTVRGESAYIELFKNYFRELAAKSALTSTGEYAAANGISGVVKSGTSAYLVNEKGLEYTQIIEKGLMGAVFYDQIQNVYLATEKMNVDNTDPVDVENGKYYTVMEHHWDEAFGYFTSATDFPNTGTDRFWGKYSNTVNGTINTNEAIMNAFIKGRAAISNKDLATRDEQIAIIRHELERVAGATAIHYVNGAISNFADDAIRNHELSEAVAFINTLYFSARETTMTTNTEIEGILEIFKDESGSYNFYDISLADLNTARDQLAEKLNLTAEKNEL